MGWLHYVYLAALLISHGHIEAGFKFMVPTPSPNIIPGALLSLSLLATAIVSPNESWYRPNPKSYQNTTVITINRTRTNISLKFPIGTMTVSNATRTSFEATTAYPQSYLLINNGSI